VDRSIHFVVTKVVHIINDFEYHNRIHFLLLLLCVFTYIFISFSLYFHRYFLSSFSNIKLYKLTPPVPNMNKATTLPCSYMDHSKALHLWLLATGSVYGHA